MYYFIFSMKGFSSKKKKKKRHTCTRYGCLLCMQMDVFSTFIELLRQTGNVTKGQVDMNELRQVHFFFKCFWFICTLAWLWVFFFFFFLVPYQLGLIIGVTPYFHGANERISRNERKQRKRLTAKELKEETKGKSQNCVLKRL